MKQPFEEFKEILNKMSPSYKKKLIESHQEFTKLRSLCEAKGYIETLPGLRGIRVLKKTSEVKKLKKLIDFLKPGKFEWTEK